MGTPSANFSSSPARLWRVVPPCGMGAVLSLHHYASGVPQSGIGGAAAFFIGRKLCAQ